MPNIEFTFDKQTGCAAGNHFEMQIKTPGNVIATVPITTETLRDDPDNREVKDAFMVLLREMLNRSNASTKENAKTLIDTASITLDFPAF